MEDKIELTIFTTDENGECETGEDKKGNTFYRIVGGYSDGYNVSGIRYKSDPNTGKGGKLLVTLHRRLSFEDKMDRYFEKREKNQKRSRG